jgi:hypothetical protein
LIRLKTLHNTGNRSNGIDFKGKFEYLEIRISEINWCRDIHRIDKEGIKKLQLMQKVGPLIDAKGQISEDGNKLMIDDGEKTRSTLTRK